MGAVVVVVLAAVCGGWYVTSAGELRVVEATADPSTARGLAGPTSTTTTPGTATTTTTTATTTTTVAPVPACTADDRPAEGDPAADWATIAIDATYAIPADYVPPDLVDVAAAGFGTGDRIRQVVVADLDALRRAAESAGLPITLVSAYRSYAYQQGLFNDEAERRGLAEAQRTTARPGHSEHQLGTAIDVTDAADAPLDAGFAATPTAQWLAEHAHDYGFVVSYPDVPAERSCYQYEPWHLRYVGREIAAEVQASGLTLREWLLSR
jgi:D-alanyl-D-alanine carboxypeptidase